MADDRQTSTGGINYVYTPQYTACDCIVCPTCGGKGRVRQNFGSNTTFTYTTSGGTPNAGQPG